MANAAFLIQLLLGVAAAFGGRWLGGKPRNVWITAAMIGAAVALGVLATRFWPVTAVHTLGAPLTACIEVTAWGIPTVLVLAIGSRQLPRERDRRAMWLLVALGGGFAIKSGLWMITPPLRPAGPVNMQNGVCRQTSDATCVAASMTTMLFAHGVDTTEEEMASLAMTDSGGASEARAIWALQRRLAATSWRPEYGTMDVASLAAVPKPCIVTLRWGLLVSHMVAVMSMDETTVTLGDPLAGVRVVTREQFAQDWRGRAIWLKRDGQ
ncbi:MAG: cysteine peptidase family C39 domain-containing protein [Phycisphaerales bacterium]